MSLFINQVVCVHVLRSGTSLSLHTQQWQRTCVLMCAWNFSRIMQGNYYIICTCKCTCTFSCKFLVFVIILICLCSSICSCFFARHTVVVVCSLYIHNQYIPLHRVFKALLKTWNILFYNCGLHSAQTACWVPHQRDDIISMIYTYIYIYIYIYVYMSCTSFHKWMPSCSHSLDSYNFAMRHQFRKCHHVQIIEYCACNGPTRRRRACARCCQRHS